MIVNGLVQNATRIVLHTPRGPQWEFGFYFSNHTERVKRLGHQKPEAMGLSMECVRDKFIASISGSLGLTSLDPYTYIYIRK